MFKLARISKAAVETNLREIRHIKLGRTSNCGLRVIVTLDPNKFAEKKQQPFDIGNQYRFKPKVALLKQPSRVLTCLIFYDHANNEKVDFPPDTTAFLYYSTSPEKPRIAGELRLRVTSRNDPASFESGSDLMLTNGQLWSRPLYSLSKLYIPLYEKLKEDRLLSDDLDSVLSNFPLKRCHYHRNDFHYTLNDTFTVDFSRRKTKFTVVTEQGVESLVLDKVFSDHRVTYGERRPYTGSALVRLERSTLAEHKGTRTIVLRFLKIITPVKCVIPLYDNYVCWPKEGELHRRTCKRKKTSLWGVNIDENTSYQRGFQLLWDT